MRLSKAQHLPIEMLISLLLPQNYPSSSRLFSVFILSSNMHYTITAPWHLRSQQHILHHLGKTHASMEHKPDFCKTPASMYSISLIVFLAATLFEI